MCAVLCLRLAPAAPSTGSPAALPARPRAALAADGLLCPALAAALDWAAQVEAARAGVARLPDTLRSRTAAGLAATRFAASCAATLAPPGALHIIAPGQEAATLAPLPLTLLPVL